MNMQITRQYEPPYKILTTETGYIMIQYENSMNIVKLRKIHTLENQYELTTNFSDYRKRRVTKHQGLCLGKELLLKKHLDSKEGVNQWAS